MEKVVSRDIIHVKAFHKKLSLTKNFFFHLKTKSQLTTTNQSSENDLFGLIVSETRPVARVL